MLKRVGMTVFTLVAAFMVLFSYVGNSQAAVSYRIFQVQLLKRLISY